jgi:hypothetical protein
MLPGITIVFNGAVGFAFGSLGVALGKFFVSLGDILEVASGGNGDHSKIPVDSNNVINEAL